MKLLYAVVGVRDRLRMWRSQQERRDQSSAPVKLRLRVQRQVQLAVLLFQRSAVESVQHAVIGPDI